jgi:T-complex protein 1 subunit zeta
MSSVQFVNSQAEVLKKAQALAMNINAGKGLVEVMKSNLGPRGTLKMLVGGAGQIKLTKDGHVLLNEMQISHPTASMIARCATAQDDTVGDGTTSNVLFIGELLKQAERLILDGLHPRLITEGYERAKSKSLELLEEFKLTRPIDASLLTQVARTSLSTKVQPEWVEMLVPIVVQSILAIANEGKEIDLHMVEILHMIHRLAGDTRLIKGLVLDHGGRHPDMPDRLKNCFILNCNVSLEYEKTEVHSGFYFNNAEQRERLIKSERMLTDERAAKIIELKRKVCTNGQGFVVINQKGIDPVCLDMLAKEGILALRRAKRRNAERLMLAVGGNALNSVDDLTIDDLGWAGSVYQEHLGEEKFTFIEECKNPKSVTVLIKGPDEHTISILKEAIRDGLRAVKNAIDDNCVIPGAGAFEIFLHAKLMEFKDEVYGKSKLGVQAFAEAILVIPKILAENSGYDVQDAVILLMDEYKKRKVPVGLNLWELKVISPEQMGIFDNYCVKKINLNIASTLAQQLLLCDEILKAGKKMGGDRGEDQAAPAPGM